MATLLVGRCVEFRIMPFSFAESYEYATAIGRNISPDEFMIDYINWGVFPLRFSFTKEKLWAFDEFFSWRRKNLRKLCLACC